MYGCLSTLRHWQQGLGLGSWLARPQPLQRMAFSNLGHSMNIVRMLHGLSRDMV